MDLKNLISELRPQGIQRSKWQGRADLSLSTISFSMSLLFASFEFSQRKLDPSLRFGTFFFFHFEWVAYSAFHEQLELVLDDTAAQLRMPFARQKGEGQSKPGGILLSSWLGNRNSPAGRRKTSKENRIYYFQAIIHTRSHLHFSKL